MAQSPKNVQEWAEKLDALYEAAMAQDEVMDRVEKATRVALGRIAREQYPRMGEWNGEQLRELANRIGQHAMGVASDLAHLENQARHGGAP